MLKVAARLSQGVANPTDRETILPGEAVISVSHSAEPSPRRDSRWLSRAGAAPDPAGLEHNRASWDIEGEAW